MKSLLRFPGIRRIARIAQDLASLRVTQEAIHSGLAEDFEQRLLATSRYEDARRLQRSARQVFSQSGEDGILNEIFRRIGTRDEVFVEVGVGDGLETNTTYLLTQGWKGLWVDGSERLVGEARHRFRVAVSEGRLRIERAFLTRENCAAVLADAGAGAQFDLLSLDVDRNTFHLWEGLDRSRPRVVVVEYNAGILPGDRWTVEYVPDRGWNGSAYFGGSLKSFEVLGDSKGYALVGCDIAGVNAFFVRHDLLGNHFLPPYTAENHHEPPRYWLSRRIGHPRCFAD